ncbi:MAG: hypothetical protein AAGA30_01025, partial [Planctomycetota bacterium]
MELTTAEETFDLVHLEKEGQFINVKSQVQYMGSVIVDRAGEDENARVLPLDVRARFDFDQRISSASKNTPQAIRYFDKAHATIKAGKGKVDSNLHENNKLVLARLKSDNQGLTQFQIASIGDQLRQKEYELLKNPGDPLCFSELFDKKNVRIGQKWKAGKSELSGLLGLNRVITSSVTMMLKSVEDGVAKIYIYGNVKGEVHDAITEMKIKGIGRLDLQNQFLTALRLSLDEERRTGHVAPGFEGKVKLDTQLKPTTENILMTKSRLAELYKGKKVKFSFQFNRPENEFQFAHETNWHIIASEKEAAVLRYLDDGQLIAQCNIVQLPERPAGQPMKLSEFQKEIIRITEDTDSRIVGADQSVTSAGDNVLRVAVDGMESDIPFIWIYHHIASNDGRRLTAVFTLEKDAIDYFAEADRTLVKNIQFKPSASSAKQARKSTGSQETR